MTTTHPLHAAFLADIIEHPDDDVPRLILADWLEEQGENERAEFIRVQVEYARIYPHFEVCRVPVDSTCTVCERGHDLSALLLGKFRVSMNRPASFAQDCPFRLMGLVAYRGPVIKWEWHRGFVCEVEMPADSWLTHADTLLASHPIREVRLDRWPVIQQKTTDTGALYFFRERQEVAWYLHRSEYVDGRKVGELLLRANWSGITFHPPGATQS